MPPRKDRITAGDLTGRPAVSNIMTSRSDAARQALTNSKGDDAANTAPVNTPSDSPTDMYMHTPRPASSSSPVPYPDTIAPPPPPRDRRSGSTYPDYDPNSTTRPPSVFRNLFRDILLGAMKARSR